MDQSKPRLWVGEARFGSRRTIVTFHLPESGPHEVEMEGNIPRIDGILRPDIPVRPVLGKSRGVYERPINVIDNTKEG